MCVCVYLHAQYSPIVEIAKIHYPTIMHSNHMTMTTSGQIMPWSDCLKTKGNVIIKLGDFCENLIVYILLSTF